MPFLFRLSSCCPCCWGQPLFVPWIPSSVDFLVISLILKKKSLRKTNPSLIPTTLLPLQFPPYISVPLHGKMFSELSTLTPFTFSLINPLLLCFHLPLYLWNCYYQGQLLLSRIITVLSRQIQFSCLHLLNLSSSSHNLFILPSSLKHFFKTCFWDITLFCSLSSIYIPSGPPTGPWVLEGTGLCSHSFF